MMPYPFDQLASDQVQPASIPPLSQPAQQFMNTAEWLNMPTIPREAGAPGNKGLGYFGKVAQPAYSSRGDYSTELAADTEVDGKHLDFPLMVPTLNSQELAHLLSGGEPTPAIYKKAVAHAMQRGQGAKDPFATQYDQRTPLP